MADKPRYYWDACLWIELISKQDSIRTQCCEYVIELAEAGKCEIWTSAFTLAEVYKRKCDDIPVGLQESKDQQFEDYIEREMIKKILVDVDVGTLARRLLRRFPKIGKPQDAIHVASCLLHNIDELHTFDREDLLALSGELERFDRRKLIICQPPYPPVDPQADLFPRSPDDDSGQEPS